MTRRSSKRISRSTFYLGLIAAAVIAVARLAPHDSPRQSHQATGHGGSSQLTWQVYFSPNGGATEAVVHELGGANKTVLVQAYSFTSAPIAQALLGAHRRGVDVRVILDDSQVTAKYSSADFFSNTGIPLKIDSSHAIAHNKVIIIDGHTVITGSFNFTRAAEEKNAENLLILRDKKLAQKYTQNWERHEEHSEVYGGR